LNVFRKPLPNPPADTQNGFRSFNHGLLDLLGLLD